MTIFFPSTLITFILLTAVVPWPTQSAEPTLRDLSFMTGCWEGSFQGSQGEGVIEEHYTTTSDNVILGTTRYLARDGTAQFEFLLIQRDSTGVHLIPYPSGRRSEDAFHLTSVGDAVAVFEAPEHDFPKRIIYRRDEKGALVARIDGGPNDPDGRGWIMSPAPCF